MKKNTAKKPSQTDAILNHLKKHRSITSVEAFEKYGATRLSAIIFNLRDKYNIDSKPMHTTNRFDRNVTYAKYIYRGKKENA